jgi:hypothetical protein
MRQVKQALGEKQYSSNIQHELARLFHLLSHLASHPQSTYLVEELDTAIATLLRLDPEKPAPEGVWQKWAYEKEQIAFARSVRKQIELQLQLSPYPLRAVFRASGPPHHRLISGLLWFLLLFAFIPATAATFAFVFPTSREVNQLQERNEILREQLIQANRDREKAERALGIVNLRLPELIAAEDSPGGSAGGISQQSILPESAEPARVQQQQELQRLQRELSTLTARLRSFQQDVAALQLTQPAPNSLTQEPAVGTTAPSPAAEVIQDTTFQSFLRLMQAGLGSREEQNQTLLTEIQQRLDQISENSDQPLDAQVYQDLRRRAEAQLDQAEPLISLLQAPVQTLQDQVQQLATLRQQLTTKRQALLELQRQLNNVTQVDAGTTAPNPEPSPPPATTPAPQNSPEAANPGSEGELERAGFLEALERVSEVVRYPAVQFLLWIIAAGALGGFTSVIVRSQRLCERTPKDQVDLFFVGFFRPVVGMSFALFLVAVLESGVFSSFLQVGAGSNQLGRNIFLYIAISFAAGFSESLVPDVMSQTLNNRRSPGENDNDELS